MRRPIWLACIICTGCGAGGGHRNEAALSFHVCARALWRPLDVVDVDRLRGGEGGEEERSSSSSSSSALAAEAARAPLYLALNQELAGKARDPAATIAFSTVFAVTLPLKAKGRQILSACIALV